MNLVLRWYLRRVLSRPIVRAVGWTEAERASFELFCRTSCGIKLFEFLRQLVANTTFKVVYQQSLSANAEARGMQNILAVLHRLRQFPLHEEAQGFDSLKDDEPSQPLSRESWRFSGGRGAIG